MKREFSLRLTESATFGDAFRVILLFPWDFFCTVCTLYIFPGEMVTNLEISHCILVQPKCVSGTSIHA